MCLGFLFLFALTTFLRSETDASLTTATLSSYVRWYLEMSLDTSCRVQQSLTNESRWCT